MVVLVWIILILLALLALSVGALVIFTARTARQVEAALPPLGRFIDVDGARIHYLDEGTGPALLRSRPRRPDAQLHPFAAS